MAEKKTVPVQTCPLQIPNKLASHQSPTSVARTKVKGEVRWKQEILKRKNQKFEKGSENFHPLFPEGCVTCLLFHRFLFCYRSSNEIHWLQYNTELTLKQCLWSSGWGEYTRVTEQHKASTSTGQTGIQNRLM